MQLCVTKSTLDLTIICMHVVWKLERFINLQVLVKEARRRVALGSGSTWTEMPTLLHRCHQSCLEYPTFKSLFPFPDVKHRESVRIRRLRLNKPLLSCKVAISQFCFKTFFTKNKGIKHKIY